MFLLSTIRSHRNLLVMLGAIGVLIAVAAAFARSPDKIAADARVLVKLDEEWSKAAQTRNADLVASFYAEAAVAYPPGEPVAVGRSAAKKVWAAYFSEPTFAISWKTERAEVAKSGDLGFTSGTYEDSFKGPDGDLVRETGKFLCIWRKQADGSWKAVHDMWNSDGE